MAIINKISRFWQGYNILGRIFWTVTLAMSFYGMGIFVYYTFQRYYSDPVSMAIDTEYIHWSFSFPAISICLVKGKPGQQLQPLMEQLNISSNIGSNANRLKTLHNCMFVNTNQLDIGLLTRCDELNSKYDVNVSDIKEMLLPKNCNVFLDLLHYNDKPYNCSDVFKFHKTELGYCFIGNSIIDNGYSFENLELRYQSASKSRRLSMRLKTFKIWQYALHVHSPEELPFYNSVSKDIYASDSKFSYNVDKIITDTDAAKKSVHQRGCRFPNEKLYGSPFHYSFSTCMNFLRIQLELQECNCTHSISPEIHRSHYCNIKGIECLLKGNIQSKARIAMEKNVCVPSCTEQILTYAGYSEMGTENDENYKNATIEIANVPYVRYKRIVTRTTLDLAGRNSCFNSWVSWAFLWRVSVKLRGSVLLPIYCE